MAGAAGDLSLVDTGTTGELQFFVPALHLELFDSSRSRRGVMVFAVCSTFPVGGKGENKAIVFICHR